MTEPENGWGLMMQPKKSTMLVIGLFFLLAMFFTDALTDDLTKRIQVDLVTLGYDPGNVEGEVTDDTIAAIAQYQAEHDMPVNGEVSPLLAGILSAAVTKQEQASAAADGKKAATKPAAPDQDEEALKQAQQACLQQKMEAAQKANQTKRGLGSLMSAVGHGASLGGYDASKVTQVSQDVYSANATAADLSAAAKDLGLTEEEVSECQNPT